jgi:hypothetical protein
MVAHGQIDTCPVKRCPGLVKRDVEVGLSAQLQFATTLPSGVR